MFSWAPVLLSGFVSVVLLLLLLCLVPIELGGRPAHFTDSEFLRSSVIPDKGVTKTI